jgi:hypothetical protein
MRPTLSTFALLAGLAPSIANCGGKAVVDGPPTSGGGSTTCTGVLCLGPDDAKRLEETASSFAMCVPAMGDPEAPGDGLRVGGIEVLASTEADVTLRLVLANLASGFVGSYPGLRLTIARDGAVVASNESGQFFGVPGCGTQETEVTLGWELVDGAILVVSATDQLGSVTVDSLAFTLQR